MHLKLLSSFWGAFQAKPWIEPRSSIEFLLPNQSYNLHGNAIMAYQQNSVSKIDILAKEMGYHISLCHELS